LVLGAAGQDLATDHQKRGRDNLLGSGRVGGWHRRTPGVLPPYLINAGRRPSGRLAVLSAYCGRGVVQKKGRCPSAGRGGDATKVTLSPVRFSASLKFLPFSADFPMD